MPTEDVTDNSPAQLGATIKLWLQRWSPVTVSRTGGRVILAAGDSGLESASRRRSRGASSAPPTRKAASKRKKPASGKAVGSRKASASRKRPSRGGAAGAS